MSLQHTNWNRRRPGADTRPETPPEQRHDSTKQPEKLEWHPESWQGFDSLQMPRYPDPDALEAVYRELQSLPPLVSSGEILQLREELAKAEDGSMVLLQGGDCAEMFSSCTAQSVVETVKLLLQMGLVVSHLSGKGVVRVGRMAGQYMKPRSSDEETRGHRSFPSYRGDAVNASEFGTERLPDPERLLEAYKRSALTVNFSRSLAMAGFTQVSRGNEWRFGSIPLPREASFEEILRLVRGPEGEVHETTPGLGETDRVYVSHEALHLGYESCQTQQVPRRSGWFNLTTHFPWLGDRTREGSPAHLEYLRGIENPVGIKVGPRADLNRLPEILTALNPRREKGKIALIHRLGAPHVAACLPDLIQCVDRLDVPVLWVSDPMHGNTVKTASGRKTRRVEDILEELGAAAVIHARMGTVLGGLHLEMTAGNVTECIGGIGPTDEDALEARYETTVDPRLNHSQSLELACRAGELFR